MVSTTGYCQNDMDAQNCDSKSAADLATCCERSAYELVEASVGCAANREVSSLAECEVALRSLGRRSDVKWKSHETVVGTCISKKGNQKANWNEAISPTSDDSSQWMVVCKKYAE